MKIFNKIQKNFTIFKNFKLPTNLKPFLFSHKRHFCIKNEKDENDTERITINCNIKLNFQIMT